MDPDDGTNAADHNVALSRSLLAADVLALLPPDSADDPEGMESLIIEIDTNAVLPPAQCHSLLIKGLERLATTKRLTGQLVIHKAKSEMTDRYVFLDASYRAIREFADVFGNAKTRPDASILDNLVVPDPTADRTQARGPGFAKLVSMIFRVWRDHIGTPLIVDSLSTTKVDAAQNVFASSQGEGIIWAVLDTGVDSAHPHFAKHETLLLPPGLSHVDLTKGNTVEFHSELPPHGFDRQGHGTHVAGIIAGEWEPSKDDPAAQEATIFRNARAGQAGVVQYPEKFKARIRGMAPKCKILAIRVLNEKDDGKLSNAIVGLQYVRQQNLNRRDLKIHGVNISLSYPFDPEWYSAGMSPLCKEIDRLVDMGVCVVVAAGNNGQAQVMASKGSNSISATGTICDPGNAKLAITVGSTHRNRPRECGVSFFSSKGPTADGRMKPDLVAPGERIVSCRSSALEGGTVGAPEYFEMSGTSMAAPHVSGAIACLLSARAEFIGRPEAVKERLLATATDLGRVPTHQGKGMLDALQLISTSYEGAAL